MASSNSHIPLPRRDLPFIKGEVKYHNDELKMANRYLARKQAERELAMDKKRAEWRVERARRGARRAVVKMEKFAEETLEGCADFNSAADDTDNVAFAASSSPASNTRDEGEICPEKPRVFELRVGQPEKCNIDKMLSP